MAQPLRFIETTSPLIVVHMPPVIGRADIHEIIQRFGRVVDRGAQYVILMDCTAVTKPPAALERQILTDWMRDEAFTRKETLYNLGTALVIPSGPLRAFMTALNWVRRPPKPQFWASTFNEGLDWACARIVDANLAITPAIEAIRVPPVARARKR